MKITGKSRAELRSFLHNAGVFLMSQDPEWRDTVIVDAWTRNQMSRVELYFPPPFDTVFVRGSGLPPKHTFKVQKMLDESLSKLNASRSDVTEIAATWGIDENKDRWWQNDNLYWLLNAESTCSMMVAGGDSVVHKRKHRIVVPDMVLIALGLPPQPPPPIIGELPYPLD